MEGFLAFMCNEMRAQLFGVRIDAGGAVCYTRSRDYGPANLLEIELCYNCNPNIVGPMDCDN